jgi:fatty acid desaturase
MSVPGLPEGPVTLGGDRQSWLERAALAAFIALPFLALVAAVPVAWGGWLSWVDVLIAVVMYAITGHGITVGFHRLFTHKAFRPRRALKVALAVAGSMAIQGPVIRWVADHRKHHKFSDRDGDPHSPWRYGETIPALARGFFHAHIGWLFDVEQTPQRQYAPDLMKDRDLVRVTRQFPLWVLVSLAAPAVLGGVLTSSWHGALTAVLLGLAGPGGAAAPRHVVDQLDLPHGGIPAVPEPGPLRQRLVAGDPVDGRVLAQPAPRRPHVRPARGHARTARTPRLA